jgi:hypothetical protein
MKRGSVGLVACVALVVGAAAVHCGSGDVLPPPSSACEPTCPSASSSVPSKPDASNPVKDAATEADAALSGPTPFPGTWEPLSGQPPGCEIMASATPGLSVPKFAWKACASARANCERFVVDWDGGDQSFFQFATSTFGAVYEDVAGVHLVYQRRSLRPAYGLAVSTLLHGPVERVYYDANASKQCSLSKYSSSPSGDALLITRDSSDFDTWAGVSSATDRGKYEFTLLTDMLGGRPYLQRMARGDGFLTLEQSGGAAIYATSFRLSDKKIVPSTGPGLTSERPIQVPGGYFAITTDSPFALGFMPMEGGYRTVVRPLAGSQVMWVDIDRTDANRIVWTEVNDTTEKVILYTSPFATTEAGIVRRAVAVLPTANGGVANAGIFATSATPSSVRLVRLSDGLGWDVPGEADTPMNEPLWVNTDSVWVFISRVLPGQPGYPDRGGLIRVGRSTLGAATIPSGL